METIKATYRIVTPMFIGGADQKPTDGIRPPTFKGALRFWWRALNWGSFRNSAASEAQALQDLHREEVRLFGGSAEQGGQGVFLLSIQHSNIQPIAPDIPRFSGRAYLAGMGLTNRLALPEGNNRQFLVVIRFRPSIPSADIDTIKDALRLFGILGGLGSRNRRGFGSITCLVGDRLPTGEELENDIDWLKTKFTIPNASPFSAFDASTLFYRGDEKNSGDEALEYVGRLMNSYRTSGTSLLPNNPTPPPAGSRYVAGGTRAISSLNFFTTDHHHVHAIASSNAVNAPHNVPPERAIFGLPHPYKFSSLNGAKVSFDHVHGNEKGRRASPLFIHIAAYTNAQKQAKYLPLLLLMPAQFLPAGTSLHVSKNGNHVGIVAAPSNYQPIKNFLASNFSAC